MKLLGTLLAGAMMLGATATADAASGRLSKKAYNSRPAAVNGGSSFEMNRANLSRTNPMKGQLNRADGKKWGSRHMRSNKRATRILPSGAAQVRSHTRLTKAGPSNKSFANTLVTVRKLKTGPNKGKWKVYTDGLADVRKN